MTFAQQLIVTPLVPLSSVVYESSGLIFLNGKIITHNDHGNLPVLYEIDSLSSSIIRQVVISNASNIDWEDICYDSVYIYIGDFGNNYNNRTDLRIYRISIVDYFNTQNNTVIADTITFSYANQVDFSISTNQTNFDAEALISKGDSLYIFTKNWKNFKTNIYSISKQLGDYSINRVDSFNSYGLITGGDFNRLTNEIILCGYTSNPFVIRLSQFYGNKFSNGIIDRQTINIQGSSQIEGITNFHNNSYLLSSEESSLGIGMLYKLEYSTSKTIGVGKKNDKALLKITNILGEPTKPKPNTPLFYICDDGTVEKRIIIE
jgi:hypothetical protein